MKVLKDDNRKIVTSFTDDFKYANKSKVIVELEEIQMRDEDYIDDFMREDSIEADKGETADEMFEKLDYKKIEKSNKIIYREKMGLLIPNAEIVFYKNNKWIGVNFNLDMQELKAINKKCEELEWI